MSTIEKAIHHYHEYERSKSNKIIYRCIHPECTHYQKRELLEGKRAICHSCKQPFLLTWKQLRNKYPVCIYCCKSPTSIALREARDMAKQFEIPDEVKQLIVETTLE